MSDPGTSFPTGRALGRSFSASIRKLTDFLRIAAIQISSRRFRVALTAIGIAVGVAAMVTTVSLGEGIRHQAVEAIRAQSDLTLLEATGDVRDETFQLITTMRIRQIQALPHVKAAAGVLHVTYATERQTFLQVMGISPGGVTGILNPKIEKGRIFTPGTHEVVLGSAIAQKLTRYEGVRVDQPFVVLIRKYDSTGRPYDQAVNLTPVGILAERSDRFDENILLDLNVASVIRDGGEDVDGVLIRVDDPERIPGVVEEVRAIGLGVTGPFEQIEAVNRLMDTIILFLAFFAVISLLVGGLMIMSTMITTIYERAREIGITMAIGASEGDVMGLILTESFYIGLAGGILGDLFGIIAATLMNTLGRPFIQARLGDELSGLFGAEITRVTPEVLVAGLLIAVGLSLVAGIYPAMRAAHQNPVDAIRSVR